LSTVGNNITRLGHDVFKRWLLSEKITKNPA
jgi:hypothetical protein